jgi:hypothetical protein
VLVPAAAVLERIGLATCVRARKRAFQALADGLTEAEREGLDALLAVDPELRRSRFAWLRDYSESPAHPPTSSSYLTGSNTCEVRKSARSARAGFHATRLAILVDEGAIMTAQHIVDLEACNIKLKSGSQLTRRWRKQDSNPRSPPSTVSSVHPGARHDPRFAERVDANDRQICGSLGRLSH